MSSKAIIVRVAGNTACPPGFTEATEARATRRTKLCVKMAEAPEVEMAAVASALPAPAPAPPADPAVDDLTGILSALAINQPVLVGVDQLVALMGSTAIGNSAGAGGQAGGRRRRHHRKSHKAGRKSHKAGRKGASRRSKSRKAGRKSRRQH